MGLGSFVRSAVRTVTKVFKPISIFKNPKLAILTIAATWLFSTLLRRPEVPDAGTSDFDQFEQGILVNKQSNDASIPVVYGTRMIGGTRIFV